jgi:4-amino-4-deoxy-L-arabinose transferase-like glycosyltransferase
MAASSVDESNSPPVRPAVTLRWIITAAVVLLWLFSVVAAYFWAHKPFDARVVVGLGRSLLSVAMWIGLTWLAAAIGRRVAGGLLVDESPATRLTLGAGLGLGLLSLLTLGLGLVGVLHPAVAWGLALGLGILLRHDLRASLADFGSITYGPTRRLLWPPNAFCRWLAVYVAASLSLTFFAALAPPTGWDALVYHLTGPRLFVEAGRIIHNIDLPYLGFPQLGEMQFTLGMLLVGDGVAPLLHFGYGLLSLIVTAALARRVFGKQVAWLAAALLLSIPSLLSLMAQAYVEATLLFYVTAAFYAFVRWRESHTQGEWDASRKWLWLVGAFCGFSMGVKYTAVAVPVALGLSVIWASRRDDRRRTAGQLAQLAMITILFGLPWLLENWLTSGNPIYPFFFSGVYWDGWRAWWYDRPGTGLAATAPWRLLIAPLEATILGTEGGDPYDATIGPVLLVSVPLLVVVWRSLKREERPVVGYLLFFFGVNYSLWLVGLARSALLLQTRLLLPVFGVVAVLGAVALNRLTVLRRPQLAVDWLARAVISLSLALLLFSSFVAFLRIDPLPVAFGLESRDDYLARRLGVYQLVMQEINALPPDSRVVFLWEPRSYACQVDCWPDALLDRFLHLTYLHHDAGSIAREWQAAGVTHVLLYRQGMQAIIQAGFDPITPRDMAVMQDLQARYLSPIRQWGDAYDLYELELTP